MLAGDTCATAELLTTTGSRSGTLVGYTHNYSGGFNCIAANGPDRVYQLRVGMAARVTVTVTPSSTSDVTLSAIVGAARCAATQRECDVSVNNAQDGAAETITLATPGDDVFVIVDALAATTPGSFTLTWSISALNPGDRCELPFQLQSGVARTDTTVGQTNDYTAGQACAGSSRLGADVAYFISVPPGQGLDVRVTPQGAMLDTSISIATSAFDCNLRCINGANTGGAGQSDVTFWNNTGTTPVLAYIVVDSAQNSSTGPFTITATVGAPVTCDPAHCPTGCCLNNQCRTGSEDAACGLGGGTCSTCGQYQQCQSAVCTDVPRPTGAPCAMATQCYESSLAVASCNATWPGGGYCSSTCLLEGFDCGGLPILGPGYCVNSRCLAKCNAPGAGQSNCRADYVCEYSNGANSQGVCVPRCQSLACGTGRVCQASGYCR